MAWVVAAIFGGFFLHKHTRFDLHNIGWCPCQIWSSRELKKAVKIDQGHYYVLSNENFWKSFWRHAIMSWLASALLKRFAKLSTQGNVSTQVYKHPRKGNHPSCVFLKHALTSKEAFARNKLSCHRNPIVLSHLFVLFFRCQMYHGDIESSISEL